MSDAPAETSGFAKPSEPDGSIQTVSGRWLDPLDPDPASIDIGDIAQALANQCRFGGHSRSFYSVAQHSAIVSDTCAERGASAAEALAALMHDAGEAYLVDLPHPLKHRSELGPAYRRAEELLEEAIRGRFDLVPQPAEMKPVDRSLLATERRAFASMSDPWPELEGFEPLEIEIEAWDPPRARREFLERFERLDAARR
jgi:5'-deoxynucleotidase YfbR-like HD superfamily hydrolase